jgi:hypothetical protein
MTHTVKQQNNMQRDKLRHSKKETGRMIDPASKH